MRLSRLEPGKQAVIKSVAGEGALRRHLLDMGLTPNTEVFVRKVAPMGDPIELCLRGYELTLRLSEAELISVEPKESFVFCSGSCSSCSSRHAHGYAADSGRGRGGQGRGRGFFGRGGKRKGRGRGFSLFAKRGTEE